MSLIAAAIRNCSHIVSVDTNTINWVRSTMAEEAGKFTYVPNFVDTKEFRPRESGPAKEGKVVILYPRRLYAPRGFWLVEKLVPYILKKYPQAEFRFVGKADEEEAKAVRKMESQHGSRVQWQCLEPQEMSGAYREADITLCPTLSSEGTSLSCLEAMASGNAVIATNVGGLPELVTDGHNGLLVAPVLEELKDAIERLIQDAELRARLGQNARQVSLAYSKEIWEARWRKVLRAVLPPPPGGWDPVRTGYEFIHLDAGGVVWDRMKQRPHHLFRALAQAGQKGYFVNDEGRADTPDPMLGLKVVGREDRLPVDRPILYIYLSTNYEKIKNFRNPVVLYDILDDPKIHEEADRGSPPEASCAYYHEKLLAEAEIVMTSSRVLYERYRRARPDILLVPNGVWPEDFRVEKGPRPEDLPPVGKALIGYYGAVAGWFDFKLVGYASEAWPDCQFVLIGLTDRKAEVEAFTASHPNVFYLGEKRYEELPQYLAHFDAAILPFVVNEVTNAVCPVKLFEYAAGGKPVVSTGFREVRQYPGVFVAENKKEFVTKLEEALKARDDAGYRQQLARLAEENTWPERAGRILAELDRRLGDSGAASHERT
jgi:glycosyltransferase involved in cell wall biosynthesis